MNERDWLQLVVHFAALCGYRVLEAAQRRPDVVVLDLGLPDLDGLTVLKRLREWSRVPVIMLTVREADDALFRSGDLEVDLAARRVTVRGQEVKLTPTDYAFLRLLIRHAGRVVTQRQILTAVWRPHAVEHTHYLRVYATHFREKLESNPARPELIQAEPDVGCKLVALS